jgi:putative hydrolase of the HAD superfamily
MDIQKIFGENLRRTRIKSGLSQSKLSIKTGFSLVYINKIEKGEENISLKNIWKFSNVLNIPISTLFSPFQDIEYKAVIFDLHYTILRLSPSRGVIYQRIFKKHGFNAPPREIKKVFSAVWNEYGDNKISEDFKNHHDERYIEEWWFNFHFKMLKKLGLENRDLARMINRDISNQFYSNHQIHEIYDDAKKILPYLKKHNIKLALATNGYKSTKRIIEYFGLSKYFDHILISCDVGFSKPDQKLYHLIAQRLSLKPDEILCVGDSYSIDIIGAKKAGCGAAIIDRKNKKRTKKYDCVYLNNLMQIKNLININE